MPIRRGRHFLQIPGPTNVPDRVLRTIAQPTIDHRGPGFASLTLEAIGGLQELFGTRGPVVVYPSSGTGAWEAALVNTLSPGDAVLMYETGHFAAQWGRLAARLGFRVDMLPGDWRSGVDPDAVEARLKSDATVKAVALVHNETSTGVTSPIAEVGRRMAALGHPALLLVDTISSLGSIEYCHDAWHVDVTVGASQKGLMLPPGLGFNAVSDRALERSRAATMPRGYWDWAPIVADLRAGFFPYTPSTNLLFGLREAVRMLREEGLPAVFARHARHAEATRRAVRGWGLEIVCRTPAECSNTVTAVRMPDGHDADALRAAALERFDLSLGTGLGQLKGSTFRIGHLGDFNDLMLAATLSGVEMALSAGGVPFARGGLLSALDYLSAS